MQTVTFASPDSIAQIGADVVDGMLTTGQLVATSPGAMPATLVAQVRTMVVLLEERLAAMNPRESTGDLALIFQRPIAR